MGVERHAFALLRQVSNPVTLASGYPAAACFKKLNLVEIPDVMEQHGFRVGAALMRRWFLGAPFSIPPTWKAGKSVSMDYRLIPARYVDTALVNMRWVLSFARVNKVYQELRHAVLGQGEETSLLASQSDLRDSLARDGKFAGVQTHFGAPAGSPIALHRTAHVNSRVVGANRHEKLLDPIDDLYCALGAFNLHAVASGSVDPVPKPASGGPTHRVTIRQLGVLALDSYDFNGDQPLGFWGHGGVARFPLSSVAMVENASFRQWRARHRRGGDFLVFSDVLWERLTQPLVWEYTI